MTNKIKYPKMFKGIFEHTQEKYGPLIEEALYKLSQMPVHKDLKPYLAYQLWENPQPTFLLCPFMFLAVAEASGGITQEHADYLPLILLSMELTGVVDDLVDQAETRSNRPTFQAHFGKESAIALCGCLSSMIFFESKKFDQRLADEFWTYWDKISLCWLWEDQHLYPEPFLFDPSINYHYEQGAYAIDYVFNTALIINGQPVMANPEVNLFLNKVGQDVDDIINLVEFRAAQGENDDLLMGRITRPTIAAIEEEPKLLDQINELWSYFRPPAAPFISIEEIQKRNAELGYQVLSLYKHIRQVIIDKGIPKVIPLLLKDFRIAVKESPAMVRPVVKDVGYAYIDRLRRCVAINLDEYS